MSLVQEYRQFDFMSPWEGAKYVLPGDEKPDEAKGSQMAYLNLMTCVSETKVKPSFLCTKGGSEYQGIFYINEQYIIGQPNGPKGGA